MIIDEHQYLNDYNSSVTRVPAIRNKVKAILIILRDVDSYLLKFAQNIM